MTAHALPISDVSATRPSMNDQSSAVPKPSLETVLEYARKQADKFLKDRAAHLPPEQKDEVRQEAQIRAWKVYDQIDPEKGWMSFIQWHCKGAILDYLRDGKGFKESAWRDDEKEEAKKTDPDFCAEIDTEESDEEESLQDAPGASEISGSTSALPKPRKSKQYLNARVSTVSQEDDRSLDVGEIAGLHGVHIAPGQSISERVQWDLVARMSAVDPQIHLIAKIIRGFSETSLAPDFGVTREMLSQRLYSFGFWLDDEYGNNPWARQALFAFGLEEAFGVPIQSRGDQGLGWNHEPVNLDSSDSLSLMSLFKQFEFGIDLGTPSPRTRIRLVPTELALPVEPDHTNQATFSFLES